MASSKRTVAVLAIVGALSLLVCCGGGSFLAKTGLDLVTEQVQSHVQEFPEIRKHIGDIESFEMDFIASTDFEDDDTFVYDIEGTRGKGRIVVRAVSTDDDEVIQSATLTLSDGRTIEIDVAGAATSNASWTAEKPFE